MLYRVVILVLIISALLGAWSYHRGSSLPDILRAEMQPAGKAAIAPPSIKLPKANPTDLPMEPVAATPTQEPWPPIRMLISKSDAELGLLSANGGLTTGPDSPLGKRHIELRMQLTDTRLMMQTQLQNIVGEFNLQPRFRRNTWSCDMAVLSCADPDAFLRDLDIALAKSGSHARAVVIAALGHSRNRRRVFSARTHPLTAGQGIVATTEAIHAPEVQTWLRGFSELNLDPSLSDPTRLNWVPAASDEDAAARCGSLEPQNRKTAAGAAAPPIPWLQVITDLSFYDLPDAAMRQGIYPVQTLGPGPEQPCVLIGIDPWMAPHRDMIDALIDGIYEGNRDVLHTPAAHDAAQAQFASMLAKSRAEASLTEVVLGPPTLYPRPKVSDCKSALRGQTARLDASYLQDLSKVQAGHQ